MAVQRWICTVPLRLRALFRRSRMDAELQEELRYHVDRQTEENMARGMSTEEARRAALRAFGGVTQQAERCRDARRVRPIEDLCQDVRYGVRALRHAPGFSAAAVLTLALGIGATVAVFTVVHGVLLRPLPFPQPERLFIVTHQPRGFLIKQPSLSDRDYLSFRAADRLFENLSAYSIGGASLTRAGDPVMLVTAAVTTEFFPVLRVLPALGRPFEAGDEQEGRNPVAILSDPLWRARFNADRAIVGKDIFLNGTRHTIVGVAPAGFGFPRDVDVWIPKLVRFDPHLTMMMPVIGRLKAGVTATQARAELETVLPPAEGGDWGTGVLPLQDLIVGDIRRPLEVFGAAALIVLLIACVNVANLQLARASARERELGMRAALGASRSRLARQLLTESTLLALTGGACGLALAAWLVPAFLSLAPAGRIPRLESIRLDAVVLAGAFLVSTLSGLVFGLAPVLRLTGNRTSDSLVPGGRAAVAGRERVRDTLVVGEIALALVLLTAAGLLLRSFVRLRGVDPGFDPHNVMTLTVDLPDSSYPSADRLHAFHQALLARLSALPDVRSAGAVNWRPFSDMVIRGDVRFQDGPAIPRGFMPDKPAVSAGYFATMGIRVLRGRAFDERDNATAPGVAIVSRSVARLFPAEDPIGRRVTLTDNPKSGEWLTIVGVVDDVRQFGPWQPSHAAIYQPYLQVTRPFFLSHMTFAVRARPNASVPAPAIRAALRHVDPNQPPAAMASMDDLVTAATADQRFQTRLLGTFAALALLLAVVGIYGLLAYSVAQRTQEIGVRIALGARRTTVVWMVLRRTLVLSAIAVAVGTAGALAASRALATSLFEITPVDPSTFLAVAMLIVAAALAAGWIPARRAAGLDPLIALRRE